MGGGGIPPDCTAIVALVVGFIGGRLYPGGSPLPEPYDDSKSNCSVAISTPTVDNIAPVDLSEEKWKLLLIVPLVAVAVVCWVSRAKKEVAVIKVKYIKLPRV